MNWYIRNFKWIHVVAVLLAGTFMVITLTRGFSQQAIELSALLLVANVVAPLLMTRAERGSQLDTSSLRVRPSIPFIGFASVMAVIYAMTAAGIVKLGGWPALILTSGPFAVAWLVIVGYRKKRRATDRRDS